MGAEQTACSGLAKLFGARVTGRRVGNTIEYTVERDGQDGQFTFAQMAALPAIVGSEHIDFRTESGHSMGSSWTGSYGHFNNLIIVVKP